MIAWSENGQSALVAPDDQFLGRKRPLTSGALSRKKLGLLFACMLIVPVTYLLPLVYGVAHGGGVATGTCFINTCHPQGQGGTVGLNFTVDVYPLGTGSRRRGATPTHVGMAYDASGLTRPGEGPFADLTEGEAACEGLLEGGRPFACAYDHMAIFVPKVAKPARSQVDTVASRTALLGMMVVVGVYVCIEALWWAMGIPSLEGALCRGEAPPSPLSYLSQIPTREEREDPNAEVGWMVVSYFPLVNTAILFCLFFVTDPMLMSMAGALWAVVRAVPLNFMRDLIVGGVSMGKVGTCLRRYEWVSSSSSARSWLTVRRMHSASANWVAPKEVPEDCTPKDKLTLQDFTPSICAMADGKSYPMWVRAQEHGDPSEGGVQASLEFEMEHTESPSPEALRMRQRCNVVASLILLLVSVLALVSSMGVTREYVVVERQIFTDDMGRTEFGEVWVLPQTQAGEVGRMMRGDPMDLLGAPRPIRNGDGGQGGEWLDRFPVGEVVECTGPYWATTWCGKDRKLEWLILNRVCAIACIVCACVGVLVHWRCLCGLSDLPPRPTLAQRRNLANLRPGDAFPEISFLVDSPGFTFSSQLPLATLLTLPLSFPNNEGMAVGLMLFLIMWVLWSMIPCDVKLYTLTPVGFTYTPYLCYGILGRWKKPKTIRWAEFIGFEQNWYGAEWRAHTAQGVGLKEIPGEAITFLLAGARAAGGREFFAPIGTEPIPPLAMPRSPAPSTVDTVTAFEDNFAPLPPNPLDGCKVDWAPCDDLL